MSVPFQVVLRVHTQQLKLCDPLQYSGSDGNRCGGAGQDLLQLIHISLVFWNGRWGSYARSRPKSLPNFYFVPSRLTALCPLEDVLLHVSTFFLGITRSPPKLPSSAN